MANTWPTTANDWQEGDVIESDWADSLENTLGTTGAFNFSRAATVVVAASDANAQWKANADYICDGTADEVQINAAVAANTTILLSEGTFNTSAYILINSGAELRGMGIGKTTIKRTGDPVTDDTPGDERGLILTQNSNPCVRDMTLDCNALCESALASQGAYGIYENIETKNHNNLTSDGATFGIGNWTNHCIFRNIYIQPPLRSGNTVDAGNQAVNCGFFISDGDNCYRTIIDGLYIDGGDVYFNGAYGGISLEDDAYDVKISNVFIRRVWNHGIAFDTVSSGTLTAGVFNNITIEDCGGGVYVTAGYVNSSFNNFNIKDLQGHANETDYLPFSIFGNNISITNFHIENSSIDAWPWGAIDISGKDCQVSNGTITSGRGYGILVSDGAERTVISNCSVSSRRKDGIRVQAVRAGAAPIDTKIHHCNIYNNDQASSNNSGVLDAGTRTEISNCNLFDDQGSPTQDYGIDASSSTSGRYIDNYINGNVLGGIDLSGASSPIVRGNTGFVTENSGTGTINNGSTSATITHGLARTPTVDDIIITLAENPTNTPGAIWVDTLGATTFKVNCENDPGASNLDFGWQARIL